MLFNTLAFAKFFAFVFVVGWVLANRRLVPLLPWTLVALYALGLPISLGSGAAVLVSLAMSAALSRLTPNGDRVPIRIAAASVLINYGALAVLTWAHAHADPVSVALLTLGVPQSPLPWALPLGILGPLVAFGILRARRVRMVFILAASYVFYAQWNWRFLPLIWGSSTLDWLLGNAIHNATTPRRRKLWLLGTVVVNLGILGIFKYFNFGVDSARTLLSSLGWQTPEVVLQVALPVGVSFFTFESMSYVIDIYRRELTPQKNYVEYLSFVAFFPHLVAGPIVRPRDLLPQLAGPARFSASEATEGLFLIAVGLLKKVAIGDYLAVNLVDRVFDAPTQYSGLECYAGMLGYATQIYCDFSGYTDIAIGIALLLGVRMPRNFDAPYKATEMVDFWRRWHISLSTWLRDYLYISLGGNRHGRIRTYLNLMATMLLGGLWHGASWTFVVWGGLHGWALAVTRAAGEAKSPTAKLLWTLVPALLAGPILGGIMTLLVFGVGGTFGGHLDWGTSRKFAFLGWGLGCALALGALHRANTPKTPTSGPAPSQGELWARLAFRGVSILATFHVVCIGWVFFRAETFQKAAVVLTQLLSFSSNHGNLPPQLLLILATGLISHWLPEEWYLRSRSAFIGLPSPLQGAILLAAGLALRHMATAQAVPFVYFQF